VPELVEVPFFPQTELDCGPAALATILNAAGVPVSPEELIDAVYVEGLGGSLQAELMGATRRNALLPVPIEPDLESLMTEVASGRPVLVLQNQRLQRLPAWHYAVVVGFSQERDRVILRSGDERRRMERAARFHRSWSLADNWGLVAVRPGDVPASTTADTYMRALVGSARQLGQAEAGRAYDAAFARWPNDALVLFLTASWRQGAADLDSARDLYRRLLQIEPAHAAARNNLAAVLLEQGCRDAALREARVALGLTQAGDAFHAAIADTVARIESATPDTAPGCELRAPR